MNKWLSGTGINRRLAVLALVLGAVAVFARPISGGAARVNPRELAAELQRGGTVSAKELAEWIVKGTTEFRVLDVRDESAFAAYHIPGAENIPVGSLADSGIAHDENVVLYADDGTRTAQAWFVMKAMGFRHVYALAGGLAGWTGQATGHPATGPQPAATVAVPKIDVPAMPGGAVKAAPKKKKEGC